MNRRFIIFLISLLAIALVCIILIQLIWINRAYRENTLRFETNVNEALAKVVERLQQKEDFGMVARHVEGRVSPVPQPVEAQQPVVKHETRSHPVPPAPPVEETARVRVVAPDKHIILPRFRDIDLPLIAREWSRDLTFVYENFEGSRDTFFIPIPDMLNADSGFWAEFNPEGWNKLEIPDIPVIINEKEIDSLIKNEQGEAPKRPIRKKVSGIVDAFKQMVVESSTSHIPIDKRLNNKELQDEISRFLMDKGIDVPFEYAVLAVGNDSLTSLHSKGYSAGLLPESYSVSLFPEDLILKPFKLVVQFPEKQAYIMESFYLMMIFSVMFTLGILVAFAVTIHLLLRQKKLADMKADFINNLTHEFKTPIATIAVAIDSIENPKVIAEPDTIRSITGVIREENKRMNSHVEQVLQIAMLDKGKFSLNREELDVVALILRASEAIRMQLDRKGGRLSISFNASGHRVMGDELHLYNVLINLLDNAIKYSVDTPVISISTKDHRNMLCIQVEDNGQGMSRDVQKHIFEKFYRVPTGNLHNVKGFGLGLSYVRAILEAHGGTIHLCWSEPGKGSCFEVRLPVINHRNGIE